MTTADRPLERRLFLKGMAGASAGLLAARGWAAENAETKLSAEHRQAVNRRRRIAVQYDAQNEYQLKFDTWLDYRFRFVDEPGSQIDSIFWDLGRLGQVLYSSEFLDQMSAPGLDDWRRQGIDMSGRLIEETKKRNLEVFWHHRVSEVDIDATGSGAAWKEKPGPLKLAHPDWTLKTWWPHGLWDFSVPAVRDCTVRTLREVVERYDVDGVQLDFARHVPFLPIGRQWELREHLTSLVRDVRSMLQQRAAARKRPLLLAAKVPQNLRGCRVDGFDVEAWAREELVDIFTLGSRSMDVDVAAFKAFTAGRSIKLQPCFDDHHTTDGYRWAPIEVLRGVFANWWEQGADSVVTFNWSNAPPDVCTRLGVSPGPLSQQIAYHEIGSRESMAWKDKTFAVERRGGYPWAEGYFNRNDDAPLPLLLKVGSEGTLRMRVSDDLATAGTRLRDAFLRVVLFNAEQDDRLVLRWNNHVLEEHDRDSNWKDSQIFSPRPQPDSGGPGIYQINPEQRLLRLDFAVPAEFTRVGENTLQFSLAARAAEKSQNADVKLEKVELHVRYVANAAS